MGLRLAANGFDTEEAHNGYQALDKATAILPDLILSDIAVPGIDGIELCRRLRADPRTAPIPILAVTGYDDRHYPDRARAAGADRVLIKPFVAETLLAEAREMLTPSARSAIDPPRSARVRGADPMGGGMIIAAPARAIRCGNAFAIHLRALVCFVVEARDIAGAWQRGAYGLKRENDRVVTEAFTFEHGCTLPCDSLAPAAHWRSAAFAPVFEGVRMIKLRSQAQNPGIGSGTAISVPQYHDVAWPATAPRRGVL